MSIEASIFHIGTGVHRKEACSFHANALDDFKVWDCNMLEIWGYAQRMRACESLVIEEMGDSTESDGDSFILTHFHRTESFHELTLTLQFLNVVEWCEVIFKPRLEELVKLAGLLKGILARHDDSEEKELFQLFPCPIEFCYCSRVNHSSSLC